MKQNQPTKVEEKTESSANSKTIYMEEEFETKDPILQNSSAGAGQSIDGIKKTFKQKGDFDLELSELLKKIPERTSRYTAAGSDAVESRIKSDMLFIKNYICDHFDEKKIYAIILGGSYGAGDGGVKIEDGVERPFHDYDFFIFFKKHSLIDFKNANVFFRSASSILTKKLGITVDFSCVYHKDHLNHLPLSLRWYDLQMGHKILIGDLHALSSRRTIDPWGFPIQEVFQLLLNRGVGVLQARRNFKQKNFNSLKISMLLYKVILAMGDGFLIAKGHYRSGMMLRYEILKCHASIPLIEELLPFYKKAINFRLHPVKEEDQKKIQMLLSKTLYFFQKFYLSLFSLYYGKTLRDFSHLATTIVKDPIVDYRGKSTMKNVLINISSFGIGCIFSKWVGAYPANRLFATLPFFLFDAEVNKFLQHFIDKALMIDHKTCSGMAGRRYDKFISIWSRFN